MTLPFDIAPYRHASPKEMRELMREVASNQREAIVQGRMKTIDVAAQRIKHEDD